MIGLSMDVELEIILEESGRSLTDVYAGIFLKLRGKMREFPVRISSVPAEIRNENSEYLLKTLPLLQQFQTK